MARLDEKRICIIIYSEDELSAAEAEYYASKLDVPSGFALEIKVAIASEYSNSVAKAYNSTMNSSDAKFKIYILSSVFIIHRSIIFDLLKLFAREDIGMIGMIGVSCIPNDYVVAGGEKVGSVNIHQYYANQTLEFNENNPRKEDYIVSAVDGFFMATQYDIPWQDSLFKGNSLINLSQCTEFINAGYKIAVPYQEKPWCIFDAKFDEREHFDSDVLEYKHHYENPIWDRIKSTVLSGCDREEPLVSVLLTCYNHEEYVEEAIRSVAAQTYKNIEVIITDDGSSDNTASIIRKTLADLNDNRFRTILAETNTRFRCFEEALATTRGKYYCGLSGDDLMNPDRIKTQVAFLENFGDRYDACFSWVDVNIDAWTNTGMDLSSIEDRKKSLEKAFNRDNFRSNDWLKQFLLYGNCLNAPSAMVKMNVFKEYGGYDFTYLQLQDMDLWIRFLMKYELYVIPEKLSVYRLVPGSLSNSGNMSNYIRTHVEMEELLYESVLNMPDDVFDRCFPDPIITDHSANDIICRKIKLLYDKHFPGDMNAVITTRLYFHYRTYPGVLKMLAEKYAVSRADMHNYTKEYSPYKKALF